MHTYLQCKTYTVTHSLVWFICSSRRFVEWEKKEIISVIGLYIMRTIEYRDIDHWGYRNIDKEKLIAKENE